MKELGFVVPPLEVMQSRLLMSDREPNDYRVRRLEDRLMKVFEIKPGTLSPTMMLNLGRAYLRPFLSLGHRFEDAIPTLSALRNMGLKIGVVSNLPWGCQTEIFREELIRFGILPLVDKSIFCRDVGFRKPAREIFEYALAMMGSGPETALFVGDRIDWDVEGAVQYGLSAVWLNRTQSSHALPQEARVISTLTELPACLSI